MTAFDSNAKSIIYVRCLNDFFLSKNRLKEVSCLRIKKKKVPAKQCFKSPGEAGGLMNRVCADGDELQPFISQPNRVPITVRAAVFISFCKYERPRPNSDFKHGDGAP